jgi:hypothetical protein
MIKQTLSKTVLALAIGSASLGAFAQVMVGAAHPCWPARTSSTTP